MIKDVSLRKLLMLDCPHKSRNAECCWWNRFRTAVDYMNEVGFENIQKQELELLDYGTKRLLEIEGLKIFGTAKEKTVDFI
jgi:cysteine desulfurase/selenocysteine lyase